MSAGAINMAIISICSITCEHTEQKIYEGLVLVDILLEPHLNVGGITEELLELSMLYPIYGMYDESVVICNDEETTYIGKIVLIDKGRVTEISNN